MNFVDLVKYIYSLDKSNIFNAITKYGIQVDQKVAPEGFISFDDLKESDQFAVLSELTNLYQKSKVVTNDMYDTKDIYRVIKSFAMSNDLPSAYVLNAMVKLAKKSSQLPDTK